MPAMPVKGIIIGVLVAAGIAAIGLVGYWTLAIWSIAGIERGYERGFLDNPPIRERERAFAARNPQWTSDGQLIFINADDRIYGVSADGSELWGIPEKRDDGRYFSPAVFGNGQVAYIRYRDIQNRTIQRAAWNGSKVKTLVNLGGSTDSGPAWSPDGTRIAFATADNEIATVNRNGGGRQVIAAPMESPPSALRWSNDGRYLAALYERHTIMAIEVDSGQQYTVARASGAEAKLSIPAWAATDELLYFAHRESPEVPTMLYSATMHGANLRAIAELGGGFDPDDRRRHRYGGPLMPGHGFYVGEIQIAPGGNTLLFAAVQPGEDDAVYLIDTDGSNRRQISRNAKRRGRSGIYEASSLYVSWSPDGERIAVYNADREQSVALYTMSADGGDVQALIRRDGLMPGYAAPF